MYVRYINPMKFNVHTATGDLDSAQTKWVQETRHYDSGFKFQALSDCYIRSYVVLDVTFNSEGRVLISIRFLVLPMRVEPDRFF